MTKQLCLFLSILTCILISCHSADQPADSGKKFIDFSAMDSTVKPGDDFYMYVNGKWINQVKIPPTENGVGGFNDLYNSTQENLHHLLDSLSRTALIQGTIEQKVGDLYASGMDTTEIDKRVFDPLKPYLQKIDGIKGPADVLSYTTFMQKENKNILFSSNVGPDDKNSNVILVAFSQSGLGLPDRDYYFKKDSATAQVVKSYQHYMFVLFRLTGNDSATAVKKVNEVYTLEKEMALSHKTNVALRDPQSNYHKLPVAALNKQMPVFSWKSTLEGMGILEDSVNVQQPGYYIRLNELLKTVKPEIWRAYLQFHTADDFSNLLSHDFVEARFNYYNKALNGQQQIKPRWNRMVSSVDGNLGEGLGQIYVNRYFSKEAKSRMLELVNNLQKAFEERINHLDWMSDSTKLKAKEKLSLFIKKIGYPDVWRDYSRVTIDRNKYFENIISCNQNEYHRVLAKIGKPVDRTEWGITTPTINAYYNPNFNEIVFPAGILQPPFFDPAADDAVNYGGVGMVIGHEMTHGFDDQGAQYDKDGNLKNWWSRDDSIKFVERTKAVNAEYNGFIAIDTFHVNGALTNGENIADLGGLNIAYDAFKMTTQGKDTVRIDGLLPDQRFFMSYANIWRSKYKDELRHELVNLDPHSPDQFRVVGPLENFNPFYATYHIQPGDKMYKDEKDRIKIW